MVRMCKKLQWWAGEEEIGHTCATSCSGGRGGGERERTRGNNTGPIKTPPKANHHRSTCKQSRCSELLPRSADRAGELQTHCNRGVASHLKPGTSCQWPDNSYKTHGFSENNH